MKALSIKQPWAWLIANGHKGVENRNWNTKYRGEFLIHASKSFDNQGYDWVKDAFPLIDMPDKKDFETGGIVGSARIIGVVHENEKHLLCKDDYPWFFGEYGFVLDGQKPLKMKPCKGALGFFKPDFNSRYKD